MVFLFLGAYSGNVDDVDILDSICRNKAVISTYITILSATSTCHRESKL